MYSNADYFESSKLLSGHLSDVDQCRGWVRDRRENVFADIVQIPFKNMQKWHQDPSSGNFVHESGKFFSVEGVQVRNWPFQPKQWDQPIILQNEIGFLGFVAQKISGALHFLVQAKIEPGNINLVQLSPTIQATRSNFLRVHGGKSPAYLDFFQFDDARTSRFDQFQSEQGTRFLDKLNRNLVVEVDPAVEIPENDDFCWMTIGQIKALAADDNLVNMDSRSVISGIDVYSAADPLETADGTDRFGNLVLQSMAPGAPSDHSDKEILEWITSQRFKKHFDCRQVPLNQVQGWRQSESKFDSDDHNFSVIATNIEIENREVVNWSQPMMQQNHSELFGFVCQIRNGSLHFLAHLKTEAGLKGKAEIGPTVQCCIAESLIGETPSSRSFLDLFLSDQDVTVHVDTMQSEEGGRFFQEQNRNMVVQIPESRRLDFPDHFRWVTLRQILNLIKYSNYLNIQARSVISLLNFNAE